MLRFQLLNLLFLISLVHSFSQINSFLPDTLEPRAIEGMDLKWNDEFNVDGKPNTEYWSYENGFQRNEELQWYQSDNAKVLGGVLILEGRKEKVVNPNYNPSYSGGNEWKYHRQYADYTSASIKTYGKVAFKYGRIEVRARFNTQSGAWPAIWTLGTSGEWPSCGEVDLLEFYKIGGVPSILANVASGTATRWQAKWDSSNKPLSYFKNKDSDWVNKFHIWRMDWDQTSIKLYLDDELLNETLLSNTNNAAGVSPTNPFKQSHYFLLNLAIGANGGDPSKSTFPMRYEVDYIRVWQKTPVLREGLLKRDNWSVLNIDSEDTSNGASNIGSKAIDGNDNTFWHSQWSPNAKPHPHHITIDLGDTAWIKGFVYLPRQDGSLNGTIADYEFYGSIDPDDFGTALISGSFAKSTKEKVIKLTDSIRCRFIKLVSLSEIQGYKVTSCAELNIFGMYEKNQITAGINNDNLFDGINIFPNPTSGNNVNIDVSNAFSSNAILHIINMQAIDIYSTTLKKGINRYNIDLSSGIYILKVVDGNTIITKKIRIQ